MSPAPARTSNDAIVRAARDILEADGLAAVTMRRVAEAVGVKGPSLYKHVPDREALLRTVANGIVEELSHVMARAEATDDARADLAAVAMTFREFVLGNPNGYGLLFTELPSGATPDPSVLAALGEPIVRAVARLSGESVALEGARTFIAWAHGFVMLESAGGFRLDGDLDAAYAFGVEAITTGLSGRATPASR
jgi:AcrR family transcriptional regulator